MDILSKTQAEPISSEAFRRCEHHVFTLIASGLSKQTYRLKVEFEDYTKSLVDEGKTCQLDPECEHNWCPKEGAENDGNDESVGP